MSWVMPTIAGLFNVMETVTFIEFIEEEALQAVGLGIFMALRQRNTKMAWKGIIVYKDVLIPHLELIWTGIGWASPATLGCFYDFIQACKLNAEIYMELATAMAKK